MIMVLSSYGLSFNVCCVLYAYSAKSCAVFIVSLYFLPVSSSRALSFSAFAFSFAILAFSSTRSTTAHSWVSGFTLQASTCRLDTMPAPMIATIIVSPTFFAHYSRKLPYKQEKLPCFYKKP